LAIGTQALQFADIFYILGWFAMAMAQVLYFFLSLLYVFFFLPSYKFSDFCLADGVELYKVVKF